MAKTDKHIKNALLPSAEQLTTVSRLAARGNQVLASQRLAALRKSFPDFKPLLGLAWEIESHCGTPMQAAARAWEWQLSDPGSQAALEALCQSAQAAGLVAVHGRALQRLAVMQRQDMPLPPSIESALGALTLEQAEAIDLSRMHLANDNLAACMAVLQGIDHPSARNNLSLALFLSGDAAQARAVMEANWQTSPDNLFALERVVRWRCWSDGLERCLGFRATFKHTQPRRSEDAIAQVAGLRFLDDEKAAQKAWKESTKAAFWKTASQGQRTVFDAAKDPQSELPGGHALWFPSQWMTSVKAIPSKPQGPAGAQWEQRWDALLEACDAHADYLGRAASLGDDLVRHLALMVLKLRATRGDASALANLKAQLMLPKGSDSDRMTLLNWLSSHGLHNNNAPIEVWMAGELRTIETTNLRIHDEFKESTFSPAGKALHERMHEAVDSGDLRLALGYAQQLQQMHPDHPMALVNLAGIKEGLKHPRAEIIALYRQAYALDPDYLFARCGLARCLAQAGQVKEAHELLDVLTKREEFHRSEYRSYLLAQQAMAVASGEYKAALSLAKSLKQLEKAMQ
jgi:tetratricopeptide (TPR) repeat protein